MKGRIFTRGLFTLPVLARRQSRLLCHLLSRGSLPPKLLTPSQLRFLRLDPSRVGTRDHRLNRQLLR
jgi:hypothetical protein